MTEQPICVPGCLRFDGGETKHHPSCPFYPESLTKWNADRIAALESENERLRKGLERIAAAQPRLDYVCISPGTAFTDTYKWHPGSPYDRGKAEAYAILTGKARAALQENDG